MNELFGTVRVESIKSVLDTIALHPKMSRAEISEMTGLSVVTIGKIADSLTKLRVVTQKYTDDIMIGRRCRVLSFNKTRFSAVYDFTNPDFTLHLCDLNGSTVRQFRYTYHKDFMIDDNLMFFIEGADSFIRNYYNPKMCIGCGCLLPGSYNPETQLIDNCRLPVLNQVKGIDSISPYLMSDNLLIGDIRLYQCKTIAMAEPAGTSAFVVFFDNDSITSCLVNGGENVERLTLAPFGTISNDAGLTLGEYMDFCDSTPKSAYAMALALLHSAKIVGIDCAYILGNRYTNMEIFSALVESNLHAMRKTSDGSFPKISCRLSVRSFAESVTHILRERWLNNEILS